MKQLHISKEVHLPIEAVTQTFAILAIKGSGKSYTASVMSEEMLKAGQQIIVLDPTGVWWGLQSSADGKKEGFSAVIFGGDHGNVPLDENSAEILAQAIVEQGFSAIIDLSVLRKGVANRFAGIFLETLYRINREPVHLFVDEADMFAPQKSFPDVARTLGAMEDIVRRGRKKGIGCTMITQRPAVINKDVLTQCEILIALRMGHPKDIAAIKEWVDVHATREEAKTMIDSLPSLPTGTAWIWSPSWLKLFKQAKIRLRETFDSGATPKPGQRLIRPKHLSKIDIKKLGKSIENIVEKKKAEDPTALKKKIAKLELDLSKAGKSVTATLVDTGETQRLRSENIRFKKALKIAIDQCRKWEALIERMAKDASKLILPKGDGNDLIPEPVFQNVKVEIPSGKMNTDRRSGAIIHVKGFEAAPVQIYKGDSERGVVSGGALRMLIAAAMYHPQPTTVQRMAALAGMSHSSGTFGVYFRALKRDNLITAAGKTVCATEEGVQAAGNFTPLPSDPDSVLEMWMNNVGRDSGMAKILKYLFSIHSSSVSAEQLGEAVQMSHKSGTFGVYERKLRKLGLIEKNNGEFKASDELFQ
jgi:hypothetical protein